MLSFDGLCFGDGLLAEYSINHKPGLALERFNRRLRVLSKDAVNIEVILAEPIEEGLKPLDVCAPVALLDVALCGQGERSRVGVRA